MAGHASLGGGAGAASMGGVKLILNQPRWRTSCRSLRNRRWWGIHPGKRSSYRKGALDATDRHTGSRPAPVPL